SVEGNIIVHLEEKRTGHKSQKMEDEKENKKLELSVSGGDDDRLVIDEKLKSAFSKIVSSDFNGVLQFWAPVETRERVYAHKYTNSNIIDILIQDKN
nr:hypothetical protein [Tanacetum cinerariifolium]